MELKDLLDVAKNELKDLSTLKNPDFRLEQAEYKKDTNVWDIVVSYLVENQNKTASAVLNGLTYDRLYKRLTVNKDKEVEGFYLYDYH